MNRVLKTFCFLILAGFPLSPGLGQSNIHVDGMNWWENRKLESRLAFLHGVEAKEPADLDAAILEDTAFLLFQQVKRQGYLQPKLTAELILSGTGEVKTVVWEDDEFWLSGQFSVDEATFRIDPGVLYYYESVEITGLESVSLDRPERYFIPGGALFNTKRVRAYTEANLDRRIQRLLDSLREMGYREAVLLDRELAMDDASGAVRVRLAIDPGSVFKVGEVKVEGIDAGALTAAWSGEVLTPQWETDRRTELLRMAYEAGYPDARLDLEVVEERSADSAQLRDLNFHLEKGEAVTLGSVRFEGDPATKRSILRRQVNLEADRPLDIQAISVGRRRVMALGIFRAVDYSLEPESGATRDVVYHLIPGKRKELQVLGGWGSYEQVRAGFRWLHRNPYGRANWYEFEVKQSLKARKADASFSVPQLFGTTATAYTSAEYDSRDEITYGRSHIGGLVGAHITLAESGVRLSAEYGLFLEETSGRDVAGFESEDDATVASLTFNAVLDRRDDFLRPTTGYSLFASYEIANEVLGGNVNFQKWEMGGNFHTPLTESTILHSSWRGGYIAAQGAAETNIPFNRRFFPGGENTVRGYRSGEASPLDASGDLIGAEFYSLLNLELEQRLLSDFSLVFFWDGLVASRGGYSGDESEWLHSVGLGLRYQTLVGPIRLEYGHNLNPREFDPSGTLHFSIGFPF